MSIKTAISWALAASLLASASAFAQAPSDQSGSLHYAPSSNPFSALVGKKRERPEQRIRGGAVQRYVLASDDRAFLFEDRSNSARIKFLCGNGDIRLDCTLDPEGPTAEIYLVTPTRGPRGDVIYKNAEGDTLLRIASYGGATVYWPGVFEGAAASRSFGDDAALRLPSADYNAARRRAASATAIVSALAGAPIAFDLGDAAERQEADHAVLADAVARAAKGLKDVADDTTGARVIAGRIGRVLFVRADAPGVSLEGDALRISYVPKADIEGRPSSSAVTRYLEETL